MPNHSHKLAKGVALATLAGAAAAGYFLAGPGGKQHRRRAAAWMNAAKKDLAGKLKDMENVSRTGYDKAVREVAAKYRQLKNIDPDEMAALGLDLKKHWHNIIKQAAGLSGKPKTRPRKKTKAA